MPTENDPGSVVLGRRRYTFDTSKKPNDYVVHKIEKTLLNSYLNGVKKYFLRALRAHASDRDLTGS